MGRDRTRVLVLALASVGLIVAGTLVLEWFVARVQGAPMGISSITLDLREAKACSPAGPCGTFPIDRIRGTGSFYPMLATVSFFGSLALAALVLYQAGSRLLAGFANESVSKIGYSVSALLAMAAIGAGYLFGPDTGTESGMGISLVVERAWGPLTLLLGIVLGNLATYYAAQPDSALDDVPLTPVRVVTPPAERARVPSDPIAKITRTSTPIPTVVKGKVAYTTLAAEITRGGIDARREDGKSFLVMWSDVVGVVARRLPAELDGAAFVDVVSTAGATLRVLPWTRLTGDPIEGEGDVRARAVGILVAARCPEAKIDKATRAFLDGVTDKAAQLPDVATLTAHDQRLA